MGALELLKNELDRRKKERLKHFTFKARAYQREIIDIFKAGTYNFFLICWARRLGKDLLAFSLACEQCLNKENTVVYYIFPTMKQGKMMILDGFTNNKKRIIEEVVSVECLLLPEKNGKLYHSDNSLRFKNGSVIYFVGAQDATDKVGGNLDLLVISEMALIKNTEVLTYLIPSITNINGKILLVSTPRFASYFNTMLEDTENNSLWYKSILKATDKKAVDDNGIAVWTDKKLEQARKLMSMEKFEQEYLCNTDIANELSIYAKSLRVATYVDNFKNGTLYISFDLGINDSTALTFVMDNTVIHHYKAVGEATQHYISYIERFIKEKNINKNNVMLILPHDANNRIDYATHLTSRRKMYAEAGFKLFVLKAHSVNKTIELTRYAIQQGKIKFLNNTNVKDMVKLMKQYEYKENADGENMLIPVHGKGMSASNTCDSLEYYCIYAFLEEYRRKEKELFKVISV
nr:hypothetical protein [Fusobacterium gastrosuis]